MLDSLASAAALSTGVWGVFVIGVFMLARSHVLARAKNKHADNEGVAIQSTASEAQFGRLEKEIERLTERVTTLERISAAKDDTIAELTALKLEVLAERAAERVLHTAAIAQRESVIAYLRMQMGQTDEQSLIQATEHVAKETGRVATAAEKAVGDEPKKRTAAK